MTVLIFPRHLYARCRGTGRAHLPGTCPWCDGGLALCERCGGAEASLTTDCPGHLMADELELAVLRGMADYRRGAGWVQRSNSERPPVGGSRGY